MDILGLVNIAESQFKKSKMIPEKAKGYFTFTKANSMGANFIIARATKLFSLDEIREFYKLLSSSFDLPVCIYLLNCSSYAIKTMVKEGVAFYVENRFAFLPFLSILGKNYRDQPVVTTSKMSMVCQNLILSLLFSNTRSISVTGGAALTGLSKMSISRAFDELEAMQFPIRIEGKQRVFHWDLPWGLLLKNALPKMSSPTKKELRLSEKIDFSNYYQSGITALSQLTLLGDNEYETIAIAKDSGEIAKLADAEEVPYFEKPGQIVSVMNYVIPYGKGLIDPVSAWLSLPENYPSDNRVRFEVGRLFAKVIDGWDSSWPLVG